MIALAVPGALLVASVLDRQDDQQRDTDAAREGVCAGRVDRLVSALNAFADQFDGLSALDAETIPPMPSMDQLREETSAFETELAQADCASAEARDAIEQWRDGADSRGPLSRAVRAALAANVLYELRDDEGGYGGGPVRLRVAPEDDLRAAVEGLPAGATVVLPAGRFRLNRTLAVIQDLTIRGAGSGRTTVTTDAPTAGILLASQVRLRLEGLRVQHGGGGTASVLVLRAGAAELEGVEVAGATRQGPAARGPQAALAGGSGVLMAGAERLVMIDSASSNNAVAGLLVATGTPRVSASRFEGNGACGVCFIGTASGRVSGSRLLSNGAGMLLGERSAPVLQENTVAANRRAGLILEGATRPVVQGNTLRSNGSIGVAVYGKAAPRVAGNDVSGHAQAGVLADVTARSVPRVLDNELGDNGSAGLVFMGRSGGVVSGNSCSGSRFGLVLDGEADPRLSDNDCAVQDQRDQGRD